MDYALQLSNLLSIFNPPYVSILVLVDYALQQSIVSIKHITAIVSILVLVDYALQQKLNVEDYTYNYQFQSLF